MNIYKDNDTYLSYINNLNYTIASYNKIRETVAEVEYPLIEGQLQEIDGQLSDAETKLTWATSGKSLCREMNIGERRNLYSFVGIGDYILRTRSMVSDLEQRLQKSKNNIVEIQSIMATWSKSPLYERGSARTGPTDKQTNTDNLLILSDLDERLNKRYREIREAGERIHRLVDDNRQYLKVNTGDARTTDAWKAYVEYIDEMLTDGFYAIVQCDLDFFRQETDRKTIRDALFQILLELQVMLTRQIRESINRLALFLSSRRKWFSFHRLNPMRPMGSLISSMGSLRMSTNKRRSFHDWRNTCHIRTIKPIFKT